MAQRSALTARRLVGAAWPALILAFLANCTIVAVALQAVNVPGDNDMIDFPVLLFASIGPVLGNCIGFLLSYRRPSRASLVGFLAPGVIITAVFIVLAVSEFAEHDDIGVLVTALLVTVTPTVVIVVALLRRRAALLGPMAGAPGAAAPLPGGYAPSAPAAPPPPSAGQTREWQVEQPPPAQPPQPPPAQPPTDRAGTTQTWDLDELTGPPPPDRPPWGQR